jgi:hypothetical protein
MQDAPAIDAAKVREPTESQKALRALTYAMVLGILGVVAYAAHAGGKAGFLGIASVGVLLAGSAALAGGTLGFLFGIPRTLQQDGVPLAGDGAGRSNGVSAVGYRVNTNLEQISDWLTKILVGVSLAQIGKIRDGLWAMSSFAAKGLGSQTAGQVFALVLLVYAGVLGFLFGYLWTRLFLAGALRIADQEAIGALVAKVEKATEKADVATEKAAVTERKLEELRNQSALDVEALNLASRQLNPSKDLPPVTQEALDAAVKQASKPIKVQIFNQAWQVRSDNWQREEDKPKMERTIPIFRALISSDVENKYHMNHGQLGFALKDKRAPEWEEAKRELTSAIELRGSWGEFGWVVYEFNRAYCNIVTDPAFREDQPSDPERKQEILDDLRIAATADQMKRIITTDDAIARWMELNRITANDLGSTG